MFPRPRSTAPSTQHPTVRSQARPRRRARRRVPLVLAVVGVATLTLAAGPADATVVYDHVPHGGTVTANTPPPTTNSTNWKIVDTEQFNSPLSPKVWDVYSGEPSSNVGTAAYSPKHVTVSGGQLHINGYVDRSVEPDGRVVTGGLGMWQRPELYGRYTMLVRMDACTDVKYAWMLWPHDNVWPQHGEIDFAEDEGGSRKVTTASLVYPGAGGGYAGSQTAAEPRTPFSGWHEIGVDWTPTSVRYRIDGQYWGATQTKHIPRTPMVFVMQTEGKARPGHVSLKGQCNAQVAWVVQYAYRGPR